MKSSSSELVKCPCLQGTLLAGFAKLRPLSFMIRLARPSASSTAPSTLLEASAIAQKPEACARKVTVDAL